VAERFSTLGYAFNIEVSGVARLVVPDTIIHVIYINVTPTVNPRF
jgi:hypothetical protein